MKFINTLILAAAFSMAAHAATVFNLIPSANPTGLGTDITIDLTVTTDGMYAFQGDLAFDPEIFQVNDFLGVGDYADLFGFTDINNSTGAVTDVLGSWTGPGLTIGTGVVVGRFLVTPLALGTGSFSFTPAYVVTDPDAFVLDFDSGSNPVSVAVTTPEPGTISMVLGGIGMLMATTRRRTR